MNFLNDLGKQVEKGVQKGLSKDLKQAIASGTSQLEKKVNSINSFTDFKNEVSNAINPNSKNSQNINQNNPAPYPMPGQNQVNNQFYAPNIDLTYHNNQNTNFSSNPAQEPNQNEQIRRILTNFLRKICIFSKNSSYLAKFLQSQLDFRRKQKIIQMWTLFL